MGKNFINVLWAKKPKNEDTGMWLPLRAHMGDVAEISRLLWDEWVPYSVKNRIAAGITCQTDGYSIVKHILVFLAYAHDLGKASPIFQSKRAFKTSETDELIRKSITEAGFPLKEEYSGLHETRHALLSHAILLRHGFDESMAVVVGGHHGVPPTDEQLYTLRGFKDSSGFNSEPWRDAQDALLALALDATGLSIEQAKPVTLTRTAQALLSGLIIIADWIASDEALCPLVPLEVYKVDCGQRASTAFNKVALPESWELEQDWDNLYYRRFGIKTARPVQEVLLNAAQNAIEPGIFVVEAPMGEGKTEASLAVAEVLAQKVKCRGIYFALPTQATSNAMFDRVIDWLKKLEDYGENYSVRLAHGRADFYENYSDLKISGKINIDEDGHASTVVHEWLTGRKKGLLADFSVGTVDQVLMAGLKQKHLVLRHLGLANKVVIIDECHAYDVYMESYLLKALNWLGAYGTPVIVLSATLPTARRQAVINAYLNRHGRKAEESKSQEWATSLAYPLITFTNGDEVCSISVQNQAHKSVPGREITVDIRQISEDMFLDTLKSVLSNGGCAGVIVNTVKRAQHFYKLAEERFGADAVELLHAGFLVKDRASREQDLLKLLGPPPEAKRPEMRVVIGTQIFEQSMDIDFDILFTDLCPMDLLLQRIGRLHRHKREKRPLGLERPICCIMGTQWGEFERGSEAVYGKYILMRTRAILPDRITLPGDIPMLVAGAYDDSIDLSFSNEVLEARDDDAQKTKARKRSAQAFQIGGPNLKSSLVNWLDISVGDSDQRGEAAVRDGSDSVEVLVIQRKGDGVYLLPWIEGGRGLPRTTPDNELAKIIAGCSVRLPSVFGSEWMIDKVINALEVEMETEGITKAWYESPWLKGTLCLILDENMEADICGYQLRYDRRLGLIHEKNI